MKVKQGQAEGFSVRELTCKFYSHSNNTKRSLTTTMTRISASSKKLLLIAIVVALILPPHCATASASGQQPRYPLGGTTGTIRRNDLSRKIQSYLIKQRAIPKTRSLQISRKNHHIPLSSGSIFTLQKPTKARVRKWFGVPDEDPGNLRCMLQREFNHGSVGMTNPCVSLGPDEKRHNNLRLRGWSKSDSIHDVAVASSDSTKANNWWPSLSFAPAHPKQWRVLRYHKKVGQGLECYKRVRDAALDWEFQNSAAGKNTQEVGLVAVTSGGGNSNPPLSRGAVVRGRYTITPSKNDNEELESVVPMHQCIGAARRFVSYGAQRIAPFLPKIYSVNPVMVVYDVVDQRGPSTTFSSTAYATMKGHLLRGEERVTVALRDETEDVEVEIISVSQAGKSLKSKALWPFIGKMQSTFFQTQMDFLHQVGLKHCQVAPDSQ